jgi:hypothetical protein
LYFLVTPGYKLNVGDMDKYFIILQKYYWKWRMKEYFTKNRRCLRIPFGLSEVRLDFFVYGASTAKAF